MARKAAAAQTGAHSAKPDETVGRAAELDLTAFTPFPGAGIHIGSRRISEGDEYALLPAELPYFRNAVAKVRRQSGAARLVARALLQRVGWAPAAIPRSAAGAPLWPEGIAGSLAHDATFAVAVVAATDDVMVLGIDIEPDLPLPDDLDLLVSTPRERRRYPPSLLKSRLLFTAKEAVYKAVHPIDGIFLDFQDIEIDLSGQVAEVSYGRRLAVRTARSGHIIALAWGSVGPSQPRLSFRAK